MGDPAFQYLPQAPATISYNPSDSDNGYTSSIVSPGGASVSYTYDGNHNLTFDGTNTLSYDVETSTSNIQNVLTGWSVNSFGQTGVLGAQGIANSNGVAAGSNSAGSPGGAITGTYSWAIN